MPISPDAAATGTRSVRAKAGARSAAGPREVLQYRDRTGLEVDAIVDTGDRWAAFEVKPGVGQIEQAATSLQKFAARVDTSKRRDPALLGVIVGSGSGYVRPDGIHVTPIGARGP